MFAMLFFVVGLVLAALYAVVQVSFEFHLKLTTPDMETNEEAETQPDETWKELTCLPASAADCDQILAALNKLDSDYYNHLMGDRSRFHREVLERTISSANCDVRVLKNRLGKVIGTAILEASEQNAKHAVLHSVWLQHNYRARGLGRRLVIEMLKSARALGYEKVKAHSPHDKQTYKFFEELGFEPAFNSEIEHLLQGLR